MNRIIILSILVFIAGLPIQAQGKAEQVKQIRKLYADAKQQIANNGKGANPCNDVLIERIDTTYVSEDFIIEEDYNLHVYFTVSRTPQGSVVYRPYFMLSNSGANGHTCYREMLFDAQSHLVFSYMKAETHAGFIVETRYYYDGKGNLVDQKHRVGNAEATANSHTWNSFDSELKLGQRNLKAFQLLMTPSQDGKVTTPSKALPAKAERLQFIRSNYTRAKQENAKVDKSEYRIGLTVTIHEQENTETPPRTDVLKFYYDRLMSSSSLVPHCYFFSEQRKSVYFTEYSEYLFHPQSHELLFFYNHAAEEGEEYETRYYYDAAGSCIEAKSNSDVNNSARILGRARQFTQFFTSILDE